MKANLHDPTLRVTSLPSWEGHGISSERTIPSTAKPQTQREDLWYSHKSYVDVVQSEL